MAVADKIVITGTGRCGTSFLMHLCTNLGLNTGYTKDEANDSINKIQGLNAGIEHGLRSDRLNNSYIIKNPEFIHVDKFKQLEKKYRIETVIIPIRDLSATAKSREYMNENTHASYGGYWLGATNAEQQEEENAIALYKFIHYLESNEIDYTLISFEKMMSDWEYLYDLLPTLVSSGYFKKKYFELIDKDKIRF